MWCVYGVLHACVCLCGVFIYVCEYAYVWMVCGMWYEVCVGVCGMYIVCVFVVYVVCVCGGVRV